MVLRGGPAVTVQGIGDFVRTMQPAGPNPIASQAEFTHHDAPDAAAVFGEDGGFTLIPEGDARVWLAEMVKEASLEELRLS
ncbi:hypothetical protein ABZ479_29895 [Streptomyces sp. NPDC005722]